MHFNIGPIYIYVAPPWDMKPVPRGNEFHSFDIDLFGHYHHATCLTDDVYKKRRFSKMF